jgi:hypothetical protein
MLRFKILASTIPLIIAAVLARSELAPAARPCIALGETSVQMASGPWQAHLNVSFTDDPARATVRVQLVDGAEAADFAVVDDIDSTEANACVATAATRFVAIAAFPSGADPVIYLSQGGNADYRIFVRSRRFTSREAAALIVGAGGSPARITAAAL